MWGRPRERVTCLRAFPFSLTMVIKNKKGNKRLGTDHEESDSLPSSWSVLDEYETADIEREREHKREHALVSLKPTRAERRDRRVAEERARDILAYEARLMQRRINKSKRSRTYVNAEPKDGEYTIRERKVNGELIGYYEFDSNRWTLTPLAPFRVRKPSVSKRHFARPHPPDFYVSDGKDDITVTFEAFDRPPLSKRGKPLYYDSVPVPNSMSISVSPSADLLITYTWSKTRIDKNKLMHALNGNISIFKCLTCDRVFHTKGLSKKAFCTDCHKQAEHIKSYEANAGSRGARGDKKTDQIAAPQAGTSSEAKGERDAERKKETSESKKDESKPEHHVVDIPETDHILPPRLYMKNTCAQPPYPYFTMFSLLTILLLTTTLVIFSEVTVIIIDAFCVIMMAAVQARYQMLTAERYLCFEFIELQDPDNIKDMRPDYMDHSKMKHRGRKALYRVKSSYSCHLDVVSTFYSKALDHVASWANPRDLTVDVEIFSQIAPSVRFVADKFAIDRIDNSINRLATVNVDRHNYEPIIDNTLTLLKAYHWHYTVVKQTAGFFSPYELTAPTRQ